MVSDKISSKYDIKIGDTVIITGDIYPVDLELKCVGIYQGPSGADNLIFHREYLDELLKPTSSINRDMAGTFIIRANSPEAKCRPDFPGDRCDVREFPISDAAGV